MDLSVAGFDWDRGNLEKCRRHGADIEAMFRRILWVTPDPSHSTRESRFRAIGMDLTGRYVFVAFTLRNVTSGLSIRPISARYMHKKEILHYEKQKAEAEKTSDAKDG